jgi:hypothetical protein
VASFGEMGVTVHLRMRNYIMIKVIIRITLILSLLLPSPLVEEFITWPLVFILE